MLKDRLTQDLVSIAFIFSLILPPTPALNSVHIVTYFYQNDCFLLLSHLSTYTYLLSSKHPAIIGTLRNVVVYFLQVSNINFKASSAFLDYATAEHDLDL